MTGQTLTVPPFPPLRWDQYFWVSEVVLPSWAGFRTRRGAYASVSSPAASDGTVGLSVMPADDARQTPPLPGQARAFQYLLDHEAAIRDAVLRAVLDEYPAMQDSFGYDGEEADLMPDIQNPEQLRSLIGLSKIHVLTVTREALAYVGFEFGCTWDPEHGLGVMTHADRVIEVGGADASFLEWIAERDAEFED